MNHNSYPDSYIRGILNTVKSIAMVGASEKAEPPELFCLQISARARLQHDPINPGHAGEDLLGRASMRGSPTSPSRSTWSIFSAARATRCHRPGSAGAKPRPQVIWMQLGVRNDEAAALAEANGLKVVMNRCPKIEYGRLSSEIAWMGVNTRTITRRKRSRAAASSACRLTAPPHAAGRRRLPIARNARAAAVKGNARRTAHYRAIVGRRNLSAPKRQFINCGRAELFCSLADLSTVAPRSG